MGLNPANTAAGRGEFASLTLDQFLDTLSLVSREVVHHHPALLERGAQNILEIGLEHRPVGRTLHYQRSTHTPLPADAREKRHVLAPVARSLLVSSLALSRPSLKGCKRGV
jgi:hypothetical protein